MKSTLMPWLVKERDLRRYLSRACHACRKGRVILFYHRARNRQAPVLLALVPYRIIHDAMAAACESIRAGRMKEVKLEDLPAILR